MNLGTLIVGPKEYIVAVADLDDAAIAEFGPVLRDTARVVEALCRPEQTYHEAGSAGPGRLSTLADHSGGPLGEAELLHLAGGGGG